MDDKQMDKLLTVIITAYNEEETIDKAVETLSSVLSNAGIKYELLFVDDGSSDSTWKLVSLTSKQYLFHINVFVYLKLLDSKKFLIKNNFF